MNLPRHIKHPIDTSVYNRMMRKDTLNRLPRIKQKVTRDQLLDNFKVRLIRKAVRDVTGIDPCVDIEYRGKKYVTSRQLFLYFLCYYGGLIQEYAGLILGKDRTTVVYACKCVQKFSQGERKYNTEYNKILIKVKKINQ